MYKKKISYRYKKNLSYFFLYTNRNVLDYPLYAVAIRIKRMKSKTH